MGGFIGKCVPYYSVGILHTWDSFLRKIAAPRICESVVDEDLIYFKPHESVRLELERPTRAVELVGVGHSGTRNSSRTEIPWTFRRCT